MLSTRAWKVRFLFQRHVLDMTCSANAGVYVCVPSDQSVLNNCFLQYINWWLVVALGTYSSKKSKFFWF